MIEQYHKWGSSGEDEKRTVKIEFSPSEPLMNYLQDMRDALKTVLTAAYAHAKSGIEGRSPNPIVLRRTVKPWYDATYSYARHHVNPLCKTAVALLKSYRKKHGKLGIPEVRRLAMRIDSALQNETERGRNCDH